MTEYDHRVREFCVRLGSISAALSYPVFAPPREDEREARAHTPEQRLVIEPSFRPYQQSFEKFVFRHKFVSMAQESPSEKSISLSLTARYAPSWKTWEGIREVVQNWHDGVYFSLEKLRAVSSSRLAFHHTKEKDSLSYKAILTAENCLKLERKAAEDRDSDDQEVSGRNQTRKPGHQTFDSSVTDNRARGDDREGSIDIELGRIDYNPTRQKLTLINHDTELMRKVLLLGFSKKASNKEVIGQFGEGLKVGALALVREGRVVTMKTGKERWRFGLSHDETFDEEVLTVFVDGRWKESNDDDDDDNDDQHDKYNDNYETNLEQMNTSVTVFPLCREDWEVYLKRFLFLSPPTDSVKSVAGTLLLGDHYKGQLYVKGVWVSDLSKDGLASGVDFVHLRIDRDRRAVIHLSDIDHQISSMWIQAIQERPDLIPYYYSLLEENKTCDVRHADFYLSETSSSLLAQHFFAVHGSMAYPVPNTVSSDLLTEIKREISKKLVMCNEVLIQVLYKSGVVEPLETIMSKASTKKSAIVPFAELTPEEIDVLQHVEKLMKLCKPEFCMATIDISESSGTASVVNSKDLGHYDIPRTLLSGKIDHHCETHQRKCFCREALIVLNILSLQSDKLVQGKFK